MKVRVLGRCDVEGVALRFRQADLVGLLAVRRGPVSRTTIASLLWPDAEPSVARHNLRQTLLVLRATSPCLVAAEGDSLRLTAWVDLWELDALLADIPSPEVLCVGELLPDVKGEWVLPAREQLARAVVSTCLRLGERALLTDPRLALGYADAAAQADTHLESARSLRVRALLAMGDRTRAESEVLSFERFVGLRGPSRLRDFLSSPEANPFAGLSLGPLGPQDRVRILTAAAPALGRPARRLLMTALDDAPRLGTEDRAAAQTALAHLALDDGDVAGAEAFARAAFDQSAPGARRGAAAYVLARVLARTDRSGEANILLARAEEEAGEERELRAWIEATRGAVLARSHALSQADRHLRAALTLAQEVGSLRLTARLRYNLACVAIWAGRPDAALREVEAGLEEAGDAMPGSRAELLLVRGRVRESEGRWSDARRDYADAAAAFRAGSDPWYLAQALTNAADLDRRRGALGEAVSAYEEANALRRGLGDRIGLATSLKGLGQARALQGDRAGAERALRDSLDAYLASGEPLAGGAVLLPLARLLSDLGRRDEALSLARRAVERLGRMQPDPGGLVTDDTMSAEAARALVGELENSP